MRPNPFRRPLTAKSRTAHVGTSACCAISFGLLFALLGCDDSGGETATSHLDAGANPHRRGSPDGGQVIQSPADAGDAGDGSKRKIVCGRLAACDPQACDMAIDAAIESERKGAGGTDDRAIVKRGCDETRLVFPHVDGTVSTYTFDAAAVLIAIETSHADPALDTCYGHPSACSAAQTCKLDWSYASSRELCAGSGGHHDAGVDAGSGCEPLASHPTLAELLPTLRFRNAWVEQGCGTIALLFPVVGFSAAAETTSGPALASDWSFEGWGYAFDSSGRLTGEWFSSPNHNEDYCEGAHVPCGEVTRCLLDKDRALHGELCASGEDGGGISSDDVGSSDDAGA